MIYRIFARILVAEGLVLLGWSMLAEAQQRDQVNVDMGLGSRGSAPSQRVKLPEGWNWEPAWRQKGDCGPVCLFVMARMTGIDASIQQVKNLVPTDPQVGCSMEVLCCKARELGMETEARFLKPEGLPDVPTPFILHGIQSVKTGEGHFLVIVGFDREKRHFLVIDPTFEDLHRVPEANIISAFSGYVLALKYPTTAKWSRWARYAIVAVGSAIFLLMVRWQWIERRWTLPGRTQERLQDSDGRE